MKNIYYRILITIQKTIGLLSALLLYFCISGVYAQQDPQYTQYMYNTQVINPGYVGAIANTQFTSQYRTQWVGLDGAPETFTFSMGKPFLKNMGLGLTFVQDQIGPSKESSINVDYAYAIQFNRSETSLVFGLKGGLHLLNIDYGILNIDNPNESVFQYNVDDRLKPMVGAGVYLYTDRWYAGLSVPNMIETTFYDDTSVSNAKQRMTFYGIAGYVFQWNDQLKLKPAILIKMEEGAPLGIDTSINLLYKEKFTFGLAYRWDASVSALTGFQAFDNFFIGYSYDHTVNALGNYNSGSHEILLRLDLFSRRRLLSPRFF